MKQDVFQARHQGEWQQMEQWLTRRATPRKRERGLDGDQVFGDLEFPARYRRVCEHLALAQRRGYSTLLVDRLQELVHQGHVVLYRPPPPRWQQLAEFFGTGFPRLVRQQWRAMTVAALLFFVPLVGFFVLLQVRPELVHSIMDTQAIAQMESMYNPSGTVQKLGRDSGTDMQMFGVYIMNNISIGFRSFAYGLVSGLGSIYILASNGVFIGSIFGHLTQIGYSGPLWRFVVGHSAPELLAIVISGGAGLQLGMALLAPGRRSRGRALVEAGIVGGRLMFGVFAMLLFAAFVEAFWSSIVWMPDAIKLAVGALFWFGIPLWLWRGGRGAGHAA
jgi:uncharacterized membrane protein SpoIIM required for sporulation